MTHLSRFVVSGSGRCGTKWMSQALTASGVPCGHERVYNASPERKWPDGIVADSSWMAAAQLDSIDVPVVLLVRHPLSVVKSWVEVGFFGRDLQNPTHGPLEEFAPQVYEWPHVPDRALAMWMILTEAVLRRADLIVRIDKLTTGGFGRLLSWAGADPGNASLGVRVPPVNQHHDARKLTGIRHDPRWADHDPDLADDAYELAHSLGYESARPEW